MNVGERMGALVAASSRHPRRMLLIAILVVLGAVWFAATHFKMTSDTNELISPKVEWRVAERRMTAAFPGNGDVLLVVIDGKTPELAEGGAARLADRLSRDHTHFRNVTRPDGGPFFGREGLLFGSVADVRQATQQILAAQPFLGPLASDPSLRGIANAIDTMVQGVTAGRTTLAQLDPLIAKIGTALAQEARGKPSFFSWQDMLSGAPGGRAVPNRRLILVHPILNYSSLMPGAAATQAIHDEAQALGLTQAHGVEVRLTGSVALSDEEFASLADKWWLVFGTMIAAMLITLMLATRSAKIMAAILITTFSGLIVTAALGLLAVGRFNLISVAFIPLFVGLGVDFGIQIGVRFQAERFNGLEPRAALAEAARRLGPSLLLAAGAVCLGFIAFMPTAYIGIAELGEIAAMGMAVALVASLTLLPALLTLFRPGRPTAELGTPALARADAWLMRRRLWVLGAFVVAMVLSIASLPFVRFDFNPLHLRNPHGEAMATLNALMRDPDRNPNTVDVLAPNLDGARAVAARLRAVPQVGQVLTAESFVPQDQAPKLALIGNAQQILDLTLNPLIPPIPPTDQETVTALRTTAADLLKAAAGASGKPAADARLLAQQFLRLAAASPAERQSAAALLVQPLMVMLDELRHALQAYPVSLQSLPPEIKSDWIAADGRARVEVLPDGTTTSNQALAKFSKAVLKVAPDATGVAVSTIAAARTISGAFVQAGIIALAVVTILLILVLRSVREAAFTLAPVVLSGFLTLGTCVVIRQPINFANIIAFPLLFGVGVAFHIYFVMAWRAGGRNLLQSALARAVFFSALATGTAFGSLWLSSHPGTASMGKILMLSLAWTLVCALIFEPALLGKPKGPIDPRRERASAPRMR